MLLTLKKINTVQGFEMYMKGTKVNNVHKLAHFLGVHPEQLREALGKLLAIKIYDDEIYIPLMVSVRVLSETLNSLKQTYPIHNGPVFLGGTTCETKWREEIQPRIKFPTYNPVVEDWTPEQQDIELEYRQKAIYKLTVITPQMKSVYSIAEVVEDAILDGGRCIFCVLDEYYGKKFTKGQKRSLQAVKNMVSKHNGVVLDNLDEVVAFLNQKNEIYFNNNTNITIEIESKF